MRNGSPLTCAADSASQKSATTKARSVPTANADRQRPRIITAKRIIANRRRLEDQPERRIPEHQAVEKPTNDREDQRPEGEDQAGIRAYPGEPRPSGRDVSGRRHQGQQGETHRADSEDDRTLQDVAVVLHRNVDVGDDAADERRQVRDAVDAQGWKRGLRCALDLGRRSGLRRPGRSSRTTSRTTRQVRHRRPGPR